MKKRKLSIHVKILLLLCTSIGLLGLDGFGVYQIDQMMQQRIIDTYAALQDEAAQRLSHHMREALINMQMLFLSHIFKNRKAVPILIGFYIARIRFYLSVMRCRPPCRTVRI